MNRMMSQLRLIMMQLVMILIHLQTAMTMNHITMCHATFSLLLDPEEVWLRDMDNGTANFPSEDGSFNLKDSGVKYLQDLIVEGPIDHYRKFRNTWRTVTSTWRILRTFQ